MAVTVVRKRITFWQWICGARIHNLTPEIVVKLQINNLISLPEARKLLVSMGIVEAQD